MRFTILTGLFGAIFATAATHAPAAAEPPDWKELVDFGKRYGMIFPPQDAKLVLVHSQTRRPVGNRSHPDDPACYDPGWLLEEMADGSIRIRSGLEEKILKPRKAREPLWRKFSMDEPKPVLGGYCAETGGTYGFLAAVVCAERADQEHASVFWQHIANEEWFRNGRGELHDVPDAEKAKLILGILLWENWEQKVTEPDANLHAIEERLQALLAEVPRLATTERKELVQHVHLTNTDSPVAEGTVEALLLQYGKLNPTLHESLFGEGWDTPQGSILRMGFDAIPELIRLSEDQRITSQRWEAVMNRTPSPKLLGDLAKDLLNRMIGSKPSRVTDPPQDDFAKAWDKIRKTDELDYFEKIAWKGGDSGNDSHEVAFAVIAGKAPERLLGIQKKFMKEAQANDSPSLLCQALAVSKLPRETKLECMEGLASEGGIGRRIGAILVLARFDQNAAKAPARELMKLLPKDAKSAYWTSAEGRASHVALAIDDDDVWKIFLEKAQNAEVGLRLEWMNPFDYMYVGDSLKNRRLAFLASFLDDKSLRDETVRKEMFDGPCAGFTYPKITVRNFAAMQIASILKIEPLDPPDLTWDEDRWTRLRREVSKRLVAEGVR